MTPVTLPVREVVGTLRDARAAAGAVRPIVVDGMLAKELARQLTAGGDASLVRVDVDPADAAAYVAVLAGPPTDSVDRRMRRATRAAIPVLAVQTDPSFSSPLSYVLATNVIDVPPGRGFPVEGIAEALARQLSHEAVALASRLPALQAAITRRLVRAASTKAAAVAALTRGGAAHFPLLLLVQQRLALDMAAAHGRPLDPQQRAPELAAVVGAGLAARTVGRRLPLPRAVRGAVTGYLVTRVLGEAATRFFASRAPEA